MEPGRAELGVAAVVVLGLTVGIGMLAASATDQPTAGREPTRPATLSPSDGFTQLHADGITGRNVSVGVVDATGFNMDTPAVRDRIRAARAFGGGPLRENGTHGTATAEVIARTAPDATFYLARVDGVDSYQHAVRWLLGKGVDVIVAPVSFYGQPGDGTGPVGRTAQQATADGTVFIAPAGNLGQSHWRGTYDEPTVTDSTVVFANESRRAFVSGGTELVIWLSWDREHAAEDYTVELYRTNGTGSQLVAFSQPYRGDEAPNERIVADVRPGRYFVVVRGPAEPTGARLRLVSPTHDLQHARARESVVTPATARGVVGVGAYNSRFDQLEPYSSHGPTADGRLGVDVVAPNRRYAGATPSGFVGTSAAAAYVGGAVTLMLDANGDLSPRHVRILLKLTARDVGPVGVDYATGHGEVVPTSAVSAAQNRTTADPSSGR
ncbi:MAG: S8 family serine peptidase [Haloarcula sp.]